MCGICGFVNFDGAPVGREVLRTMMGTLAHRGPDGEGACSLSVGGTSVALGHRRLAIVDLSPNARQPIANEDETVWVVFNGEIYNFRDLRSQLHGQGHRFRSDSDGEVILHLYEEYGDDTVGELDGMFAFALWDSRRRRLLLARDRVGKKPLYYARVGASFVFGSEVKAILRYPAFIPELSLEALPSYFTFGYPPIGETFYRGIYQLPPAHIMTVEPDARVHQSRYWEVDFSHSEKHRIPLAEAITGVRTLVTDAVRKRLMVDVPIGAFLSGGIDSSIVVGLMSKLMGKPVKTFSISFPDDPDFDESGRARRVATHFRTDHTVFRLEPSSLDLLDALVQHYDGPFGDSSAIPTFQVARLARPHVTVALTGDGGDELFAGYLRFRAAVAAEHLPVWLSHMGRFLFGLFSEPRRYHHWLRRGQRFFAEAAEPLFVRSQRWVSIFGDDVHKLLNPDIALNSRDVGIDCPPELLAQANAYSPLGRILSVNFRTHLPEDILVKMDRATMAHGLEIRSPLLDYRVAEYVAGLPDWMKLRWGSTKYVLREAFKDLIPPEIMQGEKRGFGVPLGSWIRRGLQGNLGEVLLSKGALWRDYLCAPYVTSLVHEYHKGFRDHSQRLWTIAAFEVWLRQVRSSVRP